ncbi:MAG: ABC transporter ATP-binding protein [Actinomycetota bacterium]|nr:ABC transporter ATP-binding protein [Actinomycetota bacterium]
MSAAVRLLGVSRSYGTVAAVRGLDLEVGSGEILALLGPSGCGKTTTLRLIAGFETPDAGTVEVGGKIVAGAGTRIPPEKRRVGMVFQDYALFPHLSVAQNVAYGLPNGKKRKARVEEVLALAHLEGLGERMPHELSGGQQQRVALARALAPEPAVVLLDEPFSNLDAALRTRVRIEMREILTDAGATAVFVTHDQEEALSLADEVAVMMNGTIAQKAAPEDLYHSPASREVAKFVGEANFLRGTAGEGCVRCVLGEIPAACPYKGEVEAMLRPEALRLTASPEGDATVVGREFYGHDQLLKIRLSCGDVLHSRLGAGLGLKVGDRVSVEVAGRAVAFPTAADL